jgi:hypothetical protein
MDSCDIIRPLRRLNPTHHDLDSSNLLGSREFRKISLLSSPAGSSTAQPTRPHPNSTSTTSAGSITLNHLKSGVAGGIAGCLAKTLVSPLDRVKILFQTGNPDYSKYSGSLGGVFRAIGAIWNQSGIRGLVQGHSATLFRSVLFRESLLKIYLPLGNSNTNIQKSHFCQHVGFSPMRASNLCHTISCTSR